jgi:hypothetical protein
VGKTTRDKQMSKKIKKFGDPRKRSVNHSEPNGDTNNVSVNLETQKYDNPFFQEGIYRKYLLGKFNPKEKSQYFSHSTPEVMVKCNWIKFEKDGKIYRIMKKLDNKIQVLDQGIEDGEGIFPLKYWDMFCDKLYGDWIFKFGGNIVSMYLDEKTPQEKKNSYLSFFINNLI